MTNARRRSNTFFAAAKPKRERPEDNVQKAMCEYFRFAVTPGDALLWACPNGEKRDKTTAAILVGISEEDRELLGDVTEAATLMPFGLGVVPGAPDMMLATSWNGGQIDLIETKRPKEIDSLFGTVRREKGRLSKQQRRFHAVLAALGIPVHTLDSVEAFADLLEARGVRLRCRPWRPGAPLRSATPSTAAP